MATRFLAPYSRGLRTYDPLLDLHREMNRLFDDVFGVNAGSGGSGMTAYASAPRLDMHESEQELTVEAELPGVDRADLDDRHDGDVLTISGEQRSRRDDGRCRARRRCRRNRDDLLAGTLDDAGIGFSRARRFRKRRRRGSRRFAARHDLVGRPVHGDPGHLRDRRRHRRPRRACRDRRDDVGRTAVRKEECGIA